MEPSFSQRRGLKPFKKDIQLQSIDTDLRNALWNCFHKYYRAFYIQFEGRAYYSIQDLKQFCEYLWADRLKQRIEDIPYSWGDTINRLRRMFLEPQWFEVYDIIEDVYANLQLPDNLKSGFVECINNSMEKEFGGFRFVSGKITEITSESEIREIQEVMALPIDAVRKHFETALSLLSDKKSPDYRNSIKESISAVEAICKLITNNSSATLGSALQEIENKGIIQLHQDMKDAFKKLYNYTSDASGIRHALMDAKISSDFDDAKFMLVSCSAIVNYLISKANKAGIKLA